MIVYVESNFILELALQQEQFESCLKILDFCETGKASLILPAFCIAEPYENLVRRTITRRGIRNSFNKEFDQLKRSKSYKEEIEALRSVTDLFIKIAEDELHRLYVMFDGVLAIATLVPLDRDIVKQASDLKNALKLSPQDSFVYASILHHIETAKEEKKCFLNKNVKDFGDPDIIETLTRKYNCRILFDFNSGYGYVSNQNDSISLN
jgi:predicted nucleic acid-binding protein